MGVTSTTMVLATTAVVFQMHAGKTGPICYQRQAGTERSDVTACIVSNEVPLTPR